MHENCKIKIGFICLLISLKGLGLMFLVPIIEINHEGIRSKIERLGVQSWGRLKNLLQFLFYLLVHFPIFGGYLRLKVVSYHPKWWYLTKKRTLPRRKAEGPLFEVSIEKYYTSFSHKLRFYHGLHFPLQMILMCRF